MYSSITLGSNGRLGNQLFQYAALRAVSVMNAGPTCLLPPDLNLGSSGVNSHRMHIFNSKAIYMPKQVIQNNIKNVFKEKSFHFDKDFFSLPYNTDIYGYFQSEKYFKDIEYLIRKELTFIDPIKIATDQILTSLKLDKNRSITSIHVRRTDYLNLSEHHPVCSKEYFEEAKKNFSNTQYLIFSDDPKWCEENLKDENSIIINTGKDILDLSLMSRCDNNIICNSSFSWWGAWLNSNKNKLVIAPQKWFGPAYSHYNLSDLIPESWKKICI